MKKIHIAARIFICIFLFVPVALAEALPAATFTGGEISLETAKQAYQQELAALHSFGFDEISSIEVAQYVLESLVSEAVQYHQAAQLGFTALSEEEQKQLTDDAREDYEDLIITYRDFCTEEGMTDDQIRTATEAFLLEQGVTAETVIADTLRDYWQTRLYDAVGESVQVDQAEIEECYNQLLEGQKDFLTDSPDAFEFLWEDGSAIVWYPQAMRMIRRLSIPFDADTAAVYADLVGDGDPASVNQDALDALYETLSEQTEGVMAALLGGESFQDVLTEWHSGGFETAYPICAGSTLLPEPLVNAAMALQKPGDVSDPVRTDEGIFFLLYESDVPAGAVPLNDIYDAVSDIALDEKIQSAWETQTAAWITQAQPVYYPERVIE